MQRIPIYSTKITSVEYDQVAQTLNIEFKNGEVRKYFDVTIDIYTRFLEAPSQDTFFSANIENNRSEKVGTIYDRIRAEAQSRFKSATGFKRADESSDDPWKRLRESIGKR